jgi:O-antigen/teichoic acid export membrane protein
LSSILAKLNNKHVLSLAGNGSMAILAMITVAILYRSLTPNQIGSWVFFQTVFVLLDTFRTGFLQTALIRFYAGTEPERAKNILGSVWYLALMITGILMLLNGLAFLILRFADTHLFDDTVHWFGITFIFTLPFAIASWIQQADQRFDRLLWLRLANQGLFLVTVLGLIAVQQVSLTAVFITNLLVSGLCSLLVMVLGWSRFRTLVHQTKETVASIFHFGKYTVGTTISTNLLRSSDSFIIMFVLGPAGPAALALYSIPMRLMEIIEIPLRSFLATGMPAMSEAFNQNRKEDVAYIMQKYAGMLTLCLIPVSLVAIALADVAVGLLGGSQYVGTSSVTVYRIFMSFAMFYPIDRFIGVTLDIIHQPRINFYKVLVMLATNIVFDFIGVYYGNISGVALATLFTFLSGVFFGYYWLRKYLDFTILGIFQVGYKEIVAVYQSLRMRKKLN